MEGTVALKSKVHTKTERARDGSEATAGPKDAFEDFFSRYWKKPPLSRMLSVSSWVSKKTLHVFFKSMVLNSSMP